MEKKCMGSVEKVLGGRSWGVGGCVPEPEVVYEEPIR